MESSTLVCITPAGRRRYMRLLVPLVLSSKIDRYDLWMNTDDPFDIEFCEQLATKFSKIQLVECPKKGLKGNRAIAAFYPLAAEPGTIYIKLDDDIVWGEPGFLDVLGEFRKAHPEYFFVSPLVINNALCTNVLQTFGKIRYPKYLPANVHNDIHWTNGRFARVLHEWFIQKIENDQYKELHTANVPFALNRFSINCIAWLGETFRQFGGTIDFRDDEEFLSVIKPTQLGMVNCIVGSTLVAHYAFFTQRKALDRTSVLEGYRQALLHTYRNDKSFNEYATAVEALYAQIEERSKKAPKTFVYHPVPKTWKMRILQVRVPVLQLKTVGEIKQKLDSYFDKVQ